MNEHGRLDNEIFHAWPGLLLAVCNVWLPIRIGCRSITHAGKNRQQLKCRSKRYCQQMDNFIKQNSCEDNAPEILMISCDKVYFK